MPMQLENFVLSFLFYRMFLTWSIWFKKKFWEYRKINELFNKYCLICTTVTVFVICYALAVFELSLSKLIICLIIFMKKQTIMLNELEIFNVNCKCV